MAGKHYFKLQPSEAAIFQSAANIFAAYVQAGVVTKENEAQMLRKAVTVSTSLARYVEDIVQSDEETGGTP